MKNNAILCMALMLAASAQATVLTVKHGTDLTTQVDIKKISKIKFADGMMHIMHTEGTEQIALGDIDQLRFDLVASSIKDIAADIDDLKVSVAAGHITVTVTPETAIRLNVYNLNGYNVAAADGIGVVSLNLTDLPSGIYIVKANDKTIKFIR